MVKTESRVIDGFEYTVVALPARRASKLWYRLAGIIGATVGKLGGGLKLGGLKEAFGDVGLDNFGDAVNTLMQKCTPDDLDGFMNELFYQLRKNGKEGTVDLSRPATFDLELAGQVMTIGKLLAFALEVNYADFFDVLRAQLSKAAQAKASKALSSSPESTT